jgi:hypothetical protein
MKNTQIKMKNTKEETKEEKQKELRNMKKV